jgi:hypothetical protein
MTFVIEGVTLLGQRTAWSNQHKISSEKTNILAGKVNNPCA